MDDAIKPGIRTSEHWLVLIMLAGAGVQEAIGATDNQWLGYAAGIGGCLYVVGRIALKFAARKSVTVAETQVADLRAEIDDLKNLIKEIKP